MLPSDIYTFSIQHSHLNLCMVNRLTLNYWKTSSLSPLSETSPRSGQDKPTYSAHINLMPVTFTSIGKNYIYCAKKWKRSKAELKIRACWKMKPDLATSETQFDFLRCATQPFTISEQELNLYTGQNKKRNLLLVPNQSNDGNVALINTIVF